MRTASSIFAILAAASLAACHQDVHQQAASASPAPAPPAATLSLPKVQTDKFADGIATLTAQGFKLERDYSACGHAGCILYFSKGNALFELEQPDLIDGLSCQNPDGLDTSDAKLLSDAERQQALSSKNSDPLDDCVAEEAAQPATGFPEYAGDYETVRAELIKDGWQPVQQHATVYSYGIGGEGSKPTPLPEIGDCGNAGCDAHFQKGNQYFRLYVAVNEVGDKGCLAPGVVGDKFSYSKDEKLTKYTPVSDISEDCGTP